MAKLYEREIDLIALLRELKGEDLSRLTASFFGSTEIPSCVDKPVPAPADPA
nr:hypothetical protein [uncultured Mediterranean phage uvMED]